MHNSQSVAPQNHLMFCSCFYFFIRNLYTKYAILCILDVCQSCTHLRMGHSLALDFMVFKCNSLLLQVNCFM